MELGQTPLMLDQWTWRMPVPALDPRQFPCRDAFCAVRSPRRGVRYGTKKMAPRKIGMIALLGLALGCESQGLSTSELEAAAKERVREKLGLTAESALFTNTFVGKPVQGDTVLCGTVKGRRADGSPVAPQRFIAATEPGRWLQFGPAETALPPTHPDKFANWTETCRGAREVK